jgi:hypothetical protein
MAEGGKKCCVFFPWRLFDKKFYLALWRKLRKQKP